MSRTPTPDSVAESAVDDLPWTPPLLRAEVTERLALARQATLDEAAGACLGMIAQALGARRAWLADLAPDDAVLEACIHDRHGARWAAGGLPELDDVAVAGLLRAAASEGPVEAGGGRLVGAVARAERGAGRALVLVEVDAPLPSGVASRWLEPLRPVLRAAVARRRERGGPRLEALDAELRESRQRLNATLEQASVGLGHLDGDGRWTLVNERLCTLMGRTRADLLGRTWEDLTHPDDLQMSRDLVGQVTSGEMDTFSLEKRYLRSDGTVLWGRVTVSAIRDEQGDVDFRVVAIQDIGSQRRVARALRAAAERNRAMREVIPDMIFRLTRSGVYVDYHAPDGEMLYAPPDEIIGRSVRDLLPPHVAGPAMSALEYVTAHPGTLRRFDYTLESDGEELHYEARMVAPSKDEAFAIVRDVTAWRRRETELLEARRQAEVANRTKSDFLAKMSHELRTPLNGVLGFSELLHQELFGPLNERQRGFVENILSSGRHLLSLVDDVLDLAKVEAGRMSLSREWTSLSDIADAVWRVARPMADKAGVALEVHVPDDYPAIYVDPRRMRQVLYNLLSNGIKFTPSGGRVALRAEAGARWVRLFVEDTGCGIDPQDAPRLFREFEQVATGGGEPHPEGTGLGLALTRRLVTLHGGTIEVDSRPGEGATFQIALPRVIRSPGEASPTEGSYVLVVDDDARAASLVERLLESRGVETRVARSGEEALALVTRDRPDAVLVEITAPGVQADFSERVAARWPGERVPVIALTVADDLEAGGLLAVAEHLVKPVAHRDLLVALERAGALVFPEVEA